jgi:glycerol transport system substrate-binding protein
MSAFFRRVMRVMRRRKTTLGSIVRRSRAQKQRALVEDTIMTTLHRSVSVAALLLAWGLAPAYADEAAAKKWIDSEFQPSTLSKEEQLKEMQWFIKAAEPFKGMEINVLSETIPTHEYESKTLAKAFEEITGIKVNHQLLGEGEVVQAVQTQMQTNRNLYDG